MLHNTGSRTSGKTSGKACGGMKMIMNDLSVTEMRNKNTIDIDCVSTLDMVRLMNEEDRQVPVAVAGQLDNIAAAVDCIVMHMRRGGRMFYVGAGTSGRLGVLDASECPPTFNVSPELVQGIIAGGDAALRKSAEEAEDDAAAGAALLDTYGICGDDILVGISAGGNTPFVIGAVRAAKERGIATAGICCNTDCALAALADYPITPVVGPEVIQGSTRLKAGTAQKLVLNMLSTCAMIQLGKVYGNLMIDVVPSNKKLRERAIRIIMQATDTDWAAASGYFEASEHNTKCAIVMIRQNVDAAQARAILEKNKGSIRLRA